MFIDREIAPSLRNHQINIAGAKGFVILGGCGKGWPPNTTPVQRAVALSSIGRVICLGTDDEPSEGLNSKCEYFRMPNVTSGSLRNLLNRIRPSLPCDVAVIAGPSLNQCRVALRIANEFRWAFWIDCYDHPRLPAGIAWAKHEWLRAMWHEVGACRFQAIAKHCDLLIRAIALSPATFNVPLDRQIHVMNGVSSALLTAESTSFAPDTQAASQFRCCYVGVLENERTGVLLDVVRQSVHRGLNVAFEFAGPVSDVFAGALREVLSCNRSRCTLELKGILPWKEVLQLITRSDICLYPFPNRFELNCVYPVKLGEYMAMGKPVIASDLTGAREMAGNSKGVLLLPPSNSDAWVMAISRIADDATLRREMKRENLHRASELSWEHQHRPLLTFAETHRLFL